MAFVSVLSKEPTGDNCWCGAPMIETTLSNDRVTVRCEQNVAHDGDTCDRYGHPEMWATRDRCESCNRLAQWVRVEVDEGRAYTYAAFEEEPLVRGDWVRLPGNVVQREQFAGRVLRVLDGPDKTYPGPYKTVLGSLL